MIAQVPELVRRGLDGAVEDQSDPCERACAVLMEPANEALLQAVGWE